MAKNKGKKTKKRLKNIGSSSVQMKRVVVSENTSTEPSVPVPPDSTKVTASDPEAGGKEDASDNNEKIMEEPNRVSGFIFMCNPTTKIECYRYRVFGLPMGKRDVVERIKPGAKLFLYDFELKLLYGIYEATCSGKLHLEPSAFNGKFPAQVKFKIFKECLPMPEISLRNVIRENYTGSKFKQELSGKLVRKLISTFHPLTASDTQPLPQPLTLQPWAMPPSTVENHYKHTLVVPTRDVLYIPTLQYEQVPSVVKHQPPVQTLSQHTHHRASHLEHPPRASNHLPPSSSYYAVPNPQQPCGHNVAVQLYNPSSYSRTVEGTTHLHQISDLERKYLQMPSHGDASSYTQNVAAYNSGVAQYAVPYQDNVVPYNPAAAGLAVGSSSIPQAYGAVAYNHHHQQQLTSLAQPTQQDPVNAYYSHTYLQPQVLAPGESQTSAPAPVSYYYSYAGQ